MQAMKLSVSMYHNFAFSPYLMQNSYITILLISNADTPKDSFIHEFRVAFISICNKLSGNEFCSTIVWF